MTIDPASWAALIGGIARRFRIAARQVGLDRDDLMQEGFLAVISEGEKFDPSRSADRRKYMAFIIEKRMLDAIRAYSPVGRHEREVADGRRKSKTYSPHSVTALLNLNVRSLSEKLQDSEGEETSLTLLETLGNGCESPADIAVTENHLETMCANMTVRERDIVQSLSCGLTMKQTGVEMNLSESRVSQIRTRMRERLRKDSRASG